MKSACVGVLTIIEHRTALKVTTLYPVVILVKDGWGKGTSVGK